MFIVYRAYGKTKPYNYYGYSRLTNVAEAFMIGAIRPEPKRGDVRFLAANGGLVENLIFEDIETFEHEIDAWICRNDLRAADAHAFTGPTLYPPSIADRVAADSPERIADWRYALSRRKIVESAKTARQAWAAGQWTNETIKNLLQHHPREQVVRDLDACDPATFEEKYALWETC